MPSSTLYARIEETIATEIAQGEYRPGDQLPVREGQHIFKSYVLPYHPPSPREFHDLSRVDERSIHIEQDGSPSHADEVTHDVYTQPLRRFGSPNPDS